MVNDIEDTEELELVRTADMETLAVDGGDTLQIEGEDDDAGFDPYNRV